MLVNTVKEYLARLTAVETATAYDYLPAAMHPSFANNVVDASSIAYDFTSSTAVSSINQAGYGEQWQKYMDKTKCTTLNQWYDTLDLFVEKMWTFVTPMIMYYTGAGGGMIFTGTVTITGQGLAS